MKEFISSDPFTRSLFSTYAFTTDTQLDVAMNDAVAAQQAWNETSYKERATLFLKLADLILANADGLALIATSEMGKLLSEAKAEVLKCITICEYCAVNAETVLAPTNTELNGRMVEVRYEPMGVVLGIFPWNFPYWQILRSAVPVMASGNAIIVKPAPNTPRCSLALQELVEQAGFPKGIYQTVFASEEQVQRMITDKRIHGCTLTGSEKAGSAVASLAAAHIKRSVLELGGSDPFIVLHDADLEMAAEKAVNARFQNNGQSCIAAKRFILDQRIADPFLALLVPKVRALKMGDPAKELTQIGPLARPDLRDKLAQQVDETLKQGAKIIFQADDTPAAGNFYPPTILGDIPEDSPAAREELFGPVISIFVARDENHAVRIANDSDFGLGATIWTSDSQRAKKIVGKIQAGQIFVNEILRSNAAFPFGGVKHSGFGREMGESGLREFCNLKTISA